MYILGIHDGHHSGASLFFKNKIICAISEERLSRKKNEYGFPKKSIEFCLNKARIKKKDIMHVAVSTKFLPPRYFMVKRNTNFSVKDYKKEQDNYWWPIFYQNKKKNYLEIFKNKIIKNQIYNFKKLKNEDDVVGMQKVRKNAISKFLGILEDKIFFYDHHFCHANYAYYSCPEKNKLTHIFTCDGGGDKTNGSIWKVKNNKLVNLYRTNKADIGRIYRYVTLFLNMKPSENEFKVMGLAGYSQINSQKNLELVKKYFEILDVKEDKFYYKKKIKDLYFYFKKVNKNFRFDTQAFAIQYFTEQLLFKWFFNSQKKYKFSNIAFAGGVAQNIKSIKYIMENTPIKYFYVPPGASDESLSIGAVYSHLSKLDIYKNISNLSNPYLGVSYDLFDPSILKKNNKIKIKKVKKNYVAKLLSKGNPIARYSSKSSEFGPRALGNRSIIADPRNQDIINFVNKKIKVRDFWMPFAPSIISESLNKYIINNNKAKPYYMTYSYDSTKLAKKHIPGALHPFDKTTRPQVVTKKINKDYYDLIFEFKKITGVGALLNTSYNLHGEPIVSDVKSCLKTFMKSGLRYLYIDDYLIEKKND